jgi:pimeloyl-[acyl-carrier protein] methyl ester esterase
MNNHPRVILIGGWGYPSESLYPLKAALDLHFNVSLLDACECAGSSRLTDEIGDSEPCLLAGWSMGGMLALQAAVASENLRGLVLISSTRRFFSLPDSSYGIPIANIRAMSAGLRRRPLDTMRGFYELSASPHTMQRRDSERQAEQALNADTEKLRHGLGYLMQSDLSDCLSLISVPTIVLHGANDAVITIAAATELSDRLKDSKLRIRDAMGHDLPVRDTAWIAAEVLTFWKNRVAR